MSNPDTLGTLSGRLRGHSSHGDVGVTHPFAGTPVFGDTLFRTPDPKRPKDSRGWLGFSQLTCFHASFFPFCPLFWPPLFLPLSRHVLAIFSPSKSALFCRAKGTAQSLERAVPGWIFPESSGRRFLPEICVKKGQATRRT